jgi:5-(carboxyamino)imidazole ribonucleotide synthase
MSAKPVRVGIIGGGQLGLMLAESLARLRAEIHIYDPDPHAPARRASTAFTCAAFSDSDSLAAFCARQDAVTYEFEAIDAQALRLASQQAGCRVLPAVSVLETTRSRFAERQFITRNGLPCAPFVCVTDPGELEAAVHTIGWPCIIKTDRGGYDGKGQWVLNDSDAFSSARAELSAFLPKGNSSVEKSHQSFGLLVEKKIALLAEASCIVARQRNTTGAATTRIFPVMENKHRNQILFRTRVPSSFGHALSERLQSTALQCAEAFDLEGLLTIEFFIAEAEPDAPPPILQGNSPKVPPIFINEFAPRPHNSGHITRRCTNISQFDALAYLLTAHPLPPLVGLEPPTGGHFEMINILGADTEQPGGPWTTWPQAWSADPSVLEIYDYGKAEPRPARKMGHVLRLVQERRTQHAVGIAE